MNKFSKKKKTFLIIDIILVALLIFIDQFTKHLAVVHLQDKPAYNIITEFWNSISLRTAEQHLECFRIRKSSLFWLLR